MKYLLPLAIALVFAACNNAKKADANETNATAPVEMNATEANTTAPVEMNATEANTTEANTTAE